mgnify:CR=1 FL=1
MLISLIAIKNCKKNVSLEKTASESNTIDSLLNQANDLLFNEPLNACKFLKEALPRVSEKKDQIRVQTLLAKAFFLSSQYDSATVCCEQSIDFCLKEKNKTPQIHSLLTDNYNILGNKFGRVSDNSQAIHYYKKAFEHCKRSDKQRSLPDICTNIADTYIRTGDFVNGVKFYRTALHYADSLKLPQEDLSFIYHGLGHAYTELHDYELADKFYRQTEAFLEQMDIHEKFVYLNNRGLYYYTIKDYPNSMKYHKQAFITVKDSPDYLFEQNLSKTNLAELYLLNNQPDSAQIFLEEAREFFLSIKQTTALSYIQTQELALAISQKAWDKAKAIIQTMNEENIEPSLMLIRKKYQEQYYTQTNQYKEAYHVLGDWIRLDDSLRNEQVKMRVAEIGMRYRQDTKLMKQAIVIEQQQDHMHILQLTSYLGISLCLILIILAIFFFLYYKKQKALISMQQKNKITELKMENIRNRISPHFIFNVLNRSINYNELSFKKEEVSELVKLLRQNLSLTEQLYISLEEELNFVKTYVHLESKRFDDFIFQIHTDPQVHTGQVFIPSMFIQIPVENAIKHGLRQKEGEKRLSISIQKEEASTIIRIQDNGGGFSAPRSNTDNTGLGLKIITQTICLLNENNKVKLDLSIHNITTETGETGSEVQLIIPNNYSYQLLDKKSNG